MNSIEYDASSPVNPLEQLLIVLPPESRKLLPESYAKLMVDVDSPIIEYYPISVKLDSLYKWKYYQCEPILPYMDTSHIRRAVVDITLDSEETTRNTLGNKVVVDRREGD